MEGVALLRSNMHSPLPRRDVRPAYEGMARRKTQTYGVALWRSARAPRGAPLTVTIGTPAPLSLHLAPLPGLDHV